MKKLNDILGPLLFAIVFFTFFFSLSNWMGKRNERNRINDEYRGVVIGRLNNHGPTLKIKTEKGGIKVEGLLSSDLLDKVEVGDVIHKIKNSNYCVVNNTDTVQYADSLDLF